MRPAARAKQAIDSGRRGKGDIFGAFCPATAEAYTHDDAGRTILNGVDFLERVDGWITGQLPTESAHIDAIRDNLRTHHADDVLLFCLTHPRGEFVFHPTYAAYLNLIEPWWKVFRSLAFTGRRFQTGAEMAAWRQRCTPPPPSGTRTNIRSCGAHADGIAHPVHRGVLASLSSHMWPRLAGCTT